MATTTKSDKPFRGTFRTTRGGTVALDFYATNRALALDHASTVAGDVTTAREWGPLTVVTVKRLTADDVFDAGSFYEVPDECPICGRAWTTRQECACGYRRA